MSAMNRVRVGLIGCGVIGPTHVAALALDGRAELVAACDLDLARARAIAPEARVGTDWRELVQAGDIDLIVVATPHHLHADMACAALAAGKHVWIEKPLATTPADLARILAAAKAAGRIAAGVFQHRFTPLVRRLHDLVELGHFGAVERIDLRFRCTRTAEYYASGPWRGRWDAEGGALLINQGIHSLDLACWFAGEPQRVAGRVERRRLACIEAEDAAQFTIGCRGGATVAVDFANDGVKDWDGRMHVACSRGSFTLDGFDKLLAIELTSLPLRAELEALAKVEPDAFKLPGKADYGHSHARQAADVITAIIAGRRPLVAVEDAAHALRAVLGAYHATATGAEADLASAAFTTGYRRPDLSR